MPTQRLGNVASIVYPSGRKVTITYSGGVPVTIGLAKDTATSASTLVSQIKWEPSGAPRSWIWQMASGTQLQSWYYDSSGRPVRYRLGGFLRDLSYDAGDRIVAYTHYDSATNTATAAATALNQAFGYDALGRLTGITAANATWTIAYDANGNRTSVTLNGTPSVYSTSATSNRLSAVTNPARSLSHDAAGNAVSDSAYTALIDLSGRMASTTRWCATTTYSYNNDWQRVRKANTSQILFAYSVSFRQACMN